MKKTILIALLFAITLITHHAFAKEASIQVKLPDGLYLYQPKIEKEVFSPLFIVDNGKLTDPYALASRIGKEKFIRDYVDGRIFHVYIEGEHTGTLTGVMFEFVNTCQSEEFLPDIRGEGLYEGGALNGYYSKQTFYSLDEFKRNHGSSRAIAAPAELKPDKMPGLDLTGEDKSLAIESVNKRFGPGAYRRMEKSLEKDFTEKRVVTGRSGELQYLKPVQIEGRQKGLVGSYMFRIFSRYAAKPRAMEAGHSEEILFSIFGDKTELIALAEGKEPAFNMVGMMDIYGDSNVELIMEEDMTSYKIPEISEDGKVVSVLQHSPAGWKNIYKTVWICSQIY